MTAQRDARYFECDECGHIWKPDIESKPYILKIADFAIALANDRLEMVDFTLRMHGRDATLIGS